MEPAGLFTLQASEAACFDASVAAALRKRPNQTVHQVKKSVIKVAKELIEQSAWCCELPGEAFEPRHPIHLIEELLPALNTLLAKGGLVLLQTDEKDRKFLINFDKTQIDALRLFERAIIARRRARYQQILAQVRTLYQKPVLNVVDAQKFPKLVKQIPKVLSTHHRVGPFFSDDDLAIASTCLHRWVNFLVKHPPKG